MGRVVGGDDGDVEGRLGIYTGGGGGERVGGEGGGDRGLGRVVKGGGVGV